MILQISAWKLRGNLPHAVESTWLLTEAVLIDEVPVDQMPIFAIKAAYITAITRYVSMAIQISDSRETNGCSFVTGLLDSQQDSKFKVSMYAKAQHIGLPAVFVDIRHEATHGDMPSLANLRSAAQRAMQWLWDDYWKVLEERESRTQVLEAAGSERDGLGTQGSLNAIGLMRDTAKDHLDEQIVLADPGLGIGGWDKWHGRWDSKPIGII